MKAHVRPHNGAPTLFLDDKPVYANLQWIGGFNLADPKSVALTQTAMRAFAKSGVHLYTLDGFFNDWCGPRADSALPYDFTENGPRLQAAIDADPEALFNLRLMFETRHLLDNWWNKQHPDEVEVLSQGESMSASYASTVWHTQVKELLTALVAHLRQIGMYDRVIGYQICTGTCGEWIKSWSSMDIANTDYSAPMFRYFRHWLTQRYGTDAALQAAWGKEDVTLATAEVPSAADQDTTSHYYFRDPRYERNAIDFYEAYAELCADTLLDFCHTIKVLSGGDKLTGAFYGYIMELSWNDTFFTDGFRGSGPVGLAASEVSTVQRSGHLGLAKALRSPEIDFFVSPYTYGFRGLGGDGLAMQPSESLRLHNKLYWFEEDTLMHNNFDARKRMHPVKHSLAIYKRNFAEVLTHAQGITWLENDYFAEDPSIVDAFHDLQTRFHAIGNWAVQFDRRPSADVAVFLDDESYMYEANKNGISLPLIWHQRLMNLNRFGAPHDLYLLNDLLEGRLPEYKLYIFLNIFHLNAERRAALKGQLRRAGKTALFLYAPGYINEDAEEPFGIEHMTDLTGFKFGKGSSYWTPMMHVTNFEHPITQDVSQELFWGTTRSLAPIFYLEDDDATVLGNVIGSLGRIQPGLAVKTFNAGTADAWSSVYVATPNVPSPVLRGIARFAGVHLYNEDGDVLYATPRFVSAHTVKGGPRTFKLPEPVEVVYDLYNRQLLGHNTSEFRAQLPPASTALFYTGPAASLRALDGPAAGV
jgi:hypothetical protein